MRIQDGKIRVRDPGKTSRIRNTGKCYFLLLQVLKESKLLYVAEVTDLVYSWPSNKFPIEGVLCDPHLQVVYHPCFFKAFEFFLV